MKIVKNLTLIGEGFEYDREEDFVEMSDDNPELKQEILVQMQKSLQIDSKRQSFIENNTHDQNTPFDMKHIEINIHNSRNNLEAGTIMTQ